MSLLITCHAVIEPIMSRGEYNVTEPASQFASSVTRRYPCPRVIPSFPVACRHEPDALERLLHKVLGGTRSVVSLEGRERRSVRT
jgi:hypothetical protein